MNWGLTQGLIGRAKQSLQPSGAALGPNTYLVEKDFFKMLGIAFMVHALAFAIYAMLPNEKVTDIPVRALSFKLGGEDRVAAYAPVPIITPSAPAPVAAPVMQATSEQSWRAAPNSPAPVVPAPLKPLPKLKPKPEPEVKQPRVVKIDDYVPSTPPTIAPLPAVAPTPQQYVREVGGPSAQAVAAAVKAASPDGAIGGQGAVTSTTEQTAQATRARYTQQVSAWVQRHTLYPEAASGREGRVVVRMRIDRFGNVRYQAIEQSSGVASLDLAALDVIRRANPMPAAPPDYPDSNIIEFLIPINFKAP